METSFEALNSSNTHRAYIGFAFSSVSAFFSALSGLALKYITHPSSSLTLLTRLCVQYFWLVPFLTYRKENIVHADLSTNLLLVGRALFGILATWAIIVSLSLAPLGDVIAVQYTYVSLVGIFASVCLKEPCGKLEVIFSFFTMAGVVLVARPSFLFEYSTSHVSTQRTLGIVVAFVAAVFIATTNIIIRKLGLGVHFSLSTFYYTNFGFIAVFIHAIATSVFSMPCLQDILLMGAYGINASLAQILMVKALQYEKAGPVTLVNMSQVIFAFILQFAIFGLKTTWYSMLGTALILVCAVLLTLRNIRNNRASQ